MSKVWFTSDTHLGHGNIIKYSERPFLSKSDKEALEANGGKWHSGDWKGRGSSNCKISTEAVHMMNDTLIDNINKYVKRDDVLWHLGDFAFAPKHNYYETCRNYRDRMNCDNIYLVWGNHDKREIYNLFSNTFDLHHLRVGDQLIVLCHYCMAVFDKSHRGSWHLYGHSHSNLESWADKAMPGRRSFDVGVDNAAKILGEYRPFSFDEVKDIMSKKTGFVSDHHGIRTGPTEEELQ